MKTRRTRPPLLTTCPTTRRSASRLRWRQTRKPRGPSRRNLSRQPCFRPDQPTRALCRNHPSKRCLRLRNQCLTGHPAPSNLQSLHGQPAGRLRVLCLVVRLTWSPGPGTVKRATAAQRRLSCTSLLRPRRRGRQRGKARQPRLLRLVGRRWRSRRLLRLRRPRPPGGR